MKVLILEQNRFVVAAYIREEEGGEELVALADLRRLGGKYAGKVRGAMSLFKTYAEHGKGRPYGVTNDQMHHAHYDPEILEFIKGDIRVFCFQDGNRLILTNAGLKKGQKADDKDVARAIRVREQYFTAKTDGTLRIEERKQ